MNYLHQEINNLIKKDDNIFEFLQNSALDGLWYFDLVNQENEWMNDRFWETLGYDPDKMPHKAYAWQDIIHKEDLELALLNLKNHLNDPNLPYDLVVRYIHEKGHIVWIRCRGLALRDSSGIPIRMLGAHTDITKQKESEIRLQRKLNGYNQIIEGANLAAWQWNLLNGELILNDNWVKMIGYELEDFADKDIGFWADNVHPDDVPIANQGLIDHFKKKTETYECEMRLKNKKGEWTWTLCKGKVIGWADDGRAELMTGYHQCISKRKENEQSLERYKELLDRSNEVARIGTWDVNLLKEIVTWSGVTHQIHEVNEGYTPNLAGGIEFYKEGENRERITRVFNKTVEDGVPFDEELLIITAKNNEKWIRTIGIPVLNEGRVVGVYGVFHDIDELKRAHQETERLLMVKHEKNERLTNFSHIVSHNLRSHSVNLTMLVRMMEKKHPDFTKNEVFQMLQNSTQNLSETIHHLNEVASLNVPIIEGLAIHSIESFISKAISNVSPSLVECNGTVTTSENLDFNAEIIPAYLDSAILNLLTNAIKYRSEERALEILVEVYEEEHFIVLAFTDNGLGINMAKHRHKLFGMYKVFHDHKDARGIGLFISKGQIEAMHGKITAESTVNKGSTFKIYLKK